MVVTCGFCSTKKLNRTNVDEVSYLNQQAICNEPSESISIRYSAGNGNARIDGPIDLYAAGSEKLNSKLSIESKLMQYLQN